MDQRLAGLPVDLPPAAALDVLDQVLKLLGDRNASGHLEQVSSTRIKVFMSGQNLLALSCLSHENLRHLLLPCQKLA